MMKRKISVVFIILLVLSLFASAKVIEVPNATAFMFISGKPPSGGATYLFSEDFDSSNDCYTGDTTYQNCDNTWTEDPNVTADYQDTGLDGTYAVGLDSTGAYGDISNSFTASNHVYGYYIFNYSTHNPSTTRVLMYLRESDSTTALGLKDQWDGYPDLYCYGTYDNSGPYHLDVNTTYHLWFEYDGSGATSECRIWISTNNTKPGSPTWEVTGAASGNSASKFNLYSYQSEIVGRYDKIRIDNESIGSNPQ